ncbi:MAG: XRE family transcriptional regulator [Bacteroidota bacterium]|nr:XRE family transcriptional regulator [Bacteroidota bacterium]
MRIKKNKVVVLKEDTGYSATTSIGRSFIAIEADSFDELKSRMIEALNFTFKESDKTFTLDDLSFEFDLESFFDFYKVINAKALSERIGMNQSLLAQYIKGIKKPSPAQTRRILMGVQQIGRELTEVRFLL